MPLALTLQIRIEDFGFVVNLLPIGRLGAADVSLDCVNFLFGLDVLGALFASTSIIVDWDYLHHDVIGCFAS